MLIGSKHTEETKQLIKLRVQTALKNGWMGKPLSKDTKRKISKKIKQCWRKRKRDELIKHI